MNNSLIIRLIKNGFFALISWFENSIYYKIWKGIFSYFSKLYKNSFVYFMFTRDENSVNSSIFSKAFNNTVNFFDKIFDKLKRFLKQKTNKSLIVKAFMFMYEVWQYIPVRYYGIALASFAAVSGALDSAFNGFISNRFIYLFVLGVLIGLVYPSFSVLISGEYILKLFKIKLFSSPKTLNIKTYNAVVISIISGSVFAVLNIIPGLLAFVFGIFALIIAMLHPDFIIFASIILLPFVPTMLLVGLMLLAMFAKIINHRGKFKMDGFDFAAMCLIFMNIYGVACSSAVAESFKIAAVYIVFIMFFFFARRMLKNRRKFFITIDGFIVSASLVAGYGIMEYFLGLTETTWQDEEMFDELAGRVCSTFENPNVLGEFFLLSLPLTVIRLFYLKEAKSKVLMSFLAIAQAVCLILTYSRGCWLGIILAAAIILVFCAKKLFVVMTAGIFAIPFVLPQGVIDRFLSIGNTSDSSTSYRIYIWEGTLRMLKDTWAYGIGLGTAAFNTVYPRYALGAISAPHPHNLYLLILSETGIIGIVMFIVAMIYIFKSLGFVAKTSKELKNLSIGFMASFGGYLLQGIFDNVWYNYRIYALFIIFLALVAALKDIAKEQANDKSN